MVPPGGIEPTTSALPRMRSTTGLRRQTDASKNIRGRGYSQSSAKDKAKSARWRKNRRYCNFPLVFLLAWAMTAKDDAKTTQVPGKTHEQLKAERLQQALRDNLRRRKAAQTPAPAPDHHEKATPAED